MAVNYCDGFMLIGAMPLYPFYAAKGAAHEGAGWFSVGFAPIGLVIGIGAAWIGRPVVYAVLKFGIDRCETIHSTWLQQCLFAPFAAWYLIAPWCFIGGGLWASYALCAGAAGLIF